MGATPVGHRIGNQIRGENLRESVPQKLGPAENCLRNCGLLRLPHAAAAARRHLRGASAGAW